MNLEQKKAKAKNKMDLENIQRHLYIIRLAKAWENKFSNSKNARKSDETVKSENPFVHSLWNNREKE